MCVRFHTIIMCVHVCEHAWLKLNKPVNCNCKNGNGEAEIKVTLIITIHTVHYAVHM